MAEFCLLTYRTKAEYLELTRLEREQFLAAAKRIAKATAIPRF